MDNITREEQYLSAMVGESIELPNPITRREVYLAKAAGMDVEVPDPITREEVFLKAVAESLTPYAITREFTFIPKSSTPYNFVDLTEEEYETMTTAQLSMVVGVFTVDNVEYRWPSFNYNSSKVSDSNQQTFAPGRSATALSANAIILRFKAKTAPYGLAATTANLNGEALEEIKIKFEFYSLESILQA